jgi:hypothetical protein
MNCLYNNYLHKFIKRLRRVSASISDHLPGAVAVLLTRHISVCECCIMKCVKSSSVNKITIYTHIIIIVLLIPDVLTQVSHTS